MKIQIDTSAKTIKLEQSAKITEIISVIKKLLPNDWKDYSLEAVTIINNWTNPIVWPTWPSYPSYPSYPWYITSVWDADLHAGMAETSVTGTSNTSDCVYNIQLGKLTNEQSGN